MQFYYKNKSQNKINVLNTSKKENWFWIVKISIISFASSLFLSIFSEIFLTSSNLILTIILLIIFMALNIFSDMIGLSIISCQIEEMKKENICEDLKSKCMQLIDNADKVSTILCDVIGDACGILCGVCGSIVSIIFIKKIIVSATVKIIFGSLFNSLIIGLTVFFKAILKCFAIKNSTKIVKKIGKILLKLNKFFKRKKI